MQLSKPFALLIGCISMFSNASAYASPIQSLHSTTWNDSVSSYTFEKVEPRQFSPSSNTHQNSDFFILVDGLIKLPTLRQRRGNRSELTFDEIQSLHAGWIRIENVKLDYGAQGTTLIEFQSDRSKVQFGVDFIGHENSFGKWIFGLTGQYASSSTKLKFVNSGTPIDSTSFGIGGTATIYNKEGAYVDWQLQYNRVTDYSEFTFLTRTYAGSLSSTYTAGVEFGKPYILTDHLSIVPQSQIRWASSYRNQSNSPVIQDKRINQIDGISVRASSALEYTNESLEAYFLGNFYYDTTRFLKIHYHGRTRDIASGPMSYEYGVGIQYAITRKLAFHFDGSYRGDFEKNADNEMKIIRMEIGLRQSW